MPIDAIATLKVLVVTLSHLEGEIGKLAAEITHRAKANDVARRLMTVPGIGPLIATAILRHGSVWCHGSIPPVI